MVRELAYRLGTLLFLNDRYVDLAVVANFVVRDENE